MKRRLGPFYKQGAALQAEMARTRVPHGSVAVWHLGQAGVAMNGIGSSAFLLVDPYLTFSIEERTPQSELRRGFEPPIEPSEVVYAKGVLVTHSHYDLFANNRENPAYFVDYVLHTSPAQKFHMSVTYERFVLMK